MEEEVDRKFDVDDDDDDDVIEPIAVVVAGAPAAGAEADGLPVGIAPQKSWCTPFLTVY